MVADRNGPRARERRRFLRSVPLLAGSSAAVLVEVLVLVGLRPLRTWIPVACILIGTGAVLAWIDRGQHRPNVVTYRIAVASLVVSVASLLLAIVTYLGGFAWLG